MFNSEIAWKSGFTGGEVVKNPPANSGDTRDVASIPGLGRFPGEGNGNPFQYSCLGNPMDREAWRATVHGVTESDKIEWLSTHTCSLKFCLCLWWDPHLSFLGSLWSCPKAVSIFPSVHECWWYWLYSCQYGGFLWQNFSGIELTIYICMYVCISLFEISYST